MRKIVWTTVFWLIVLAAFIGYMKWVDNGQVSQYVADHFLNSDSVTHQESNDNVKLEEKLDELSQKLDVLGQNISEETQNVVEVAPEKLENADNNGENNRENNREKIADGVVVNDSEDIHQEELPEKVGDIEKVEISETNLDNLSAEELKKVKELLNELQKASS